VSLHYLVKYWCRKTISWLMKNVKGSVPTRLWCDGVFNKHFIANLMVGPNGKSFENRPTFGAVAGKKGWLSHAPCPVWRWIVSQRFWRMAGSNCYIQEEHLRTVCPTNLDCDNIKLVWPTFDSLTHQQLTICCMSTNAFCHDVFLLGCCRCVQLVILWVSRVAMHMHHQYLFISERNDGIGAAAIFQQMFQRLSLACQ